MTTKTPYDWLRYIEKALVDLDQIPILGHNEPFPWEKLTEKLRELLQIPNLEITPKNLQWHTADAINDHFGKEGLNVNIAMLPLQGHVSLMMTSADVNTLVSWAIEHKSGSNTLISSAFSEGLVYFLGAELIHYLQPFKCFDGFLIRLLTDQSKVTTRALTLDIVIKAYKEQIFCRLVVPEVFRKFWLAHFSKKPKAITTQAQKNLELSCSLEVAKLIFNYKEWHSLKVGDLLLLPENNINPDNHSGSLYLNVEQTPLFRVRIKQEGVKILEQPIYQEEPPVMDNEFGETFSSKFDQDKRRALDPIPEELEQEEGEEDFMEQEFEEEEKEQAKASFAVQESRPLLEKIETVPLQVSVELTRFKMTCEKLMHLKPGNLLELNVSLEKPVDLVVNGKKIATGELVRIGEALGIQITEIG